MVIKKKLAHYECKHQHPCAVINPNVVVYTDICPRAFVVECSVLDVFYTAFILSERKFWYAKTCLNYTISFLIVIFICYSTICVAEIQYTFHIHMYKCSHILPAQLYAFHSGGRQRRQCAVVCPFHLVKKTARTTSTSTRRRCTMYPLVQRNI